MNEMIQPKLIEIENDDGVVKTFVISKLPYSVGREVLSQFIPTSIPKVGDYPANHELMVKMMKFISVIKEDGTEQRLTTQALIDNHIEGFKQGVILERAMLEYNIGFLGRGNLSTFLEELKAMLPKLISEMLTAYKAQLSQAEGQH
jgi:hypothetical protein